MKRASTFVLVSAALVAAAACGSSSDGTPSGSSGSGGSDASGVCNAGDTRTCVGPGACSGGQVCGSDGTWGACDCGAGGLAGASGGTGTGGASGDASSAGGGAGVGPGGTGGASGGGGSSGGGAGAAGAGPVADDPCPSGAIDLNCSNSCGGPSGNCDAQARDAMTCTTDPSKMITLTSKSQFPFVVRTPSHPGSDARCTQNCSPPDTVWQLSLVVKVPLGQGVYAQAKDPWQVRVAGFGPPSTCHEDAANCYEGGAANGILEIKTSDPAAPSQDITISLTALANACP